jgi:hypothetical protein
MQRPDLPRAVILSAAVMAAACAPGAARAQGLFGLFQQGAASSYAPAQQPPAAAPMNILPINPDAGAVSSGQRRGVRTPPPSPAAMPIEEDDHGDLLLEHDQPKRVSVLLPPPRPGASPRAAEEVAPVGEQRWSSVAAVAPGLGVPGLSPAGEVQTIPAAPRLAALPQTRALPSWTLTDEAPLRPPGLRESERPVEDMPGVYAPPEAVFQCLPDGLKQVLLDAAKRFGHVAVLNARRGYGTGARGSYHYRCRAVDFRVRGVPAASVLAFLRQHPNVGGRKIYPMGFFHIDDGPVRSW